LATGKSGKLHENAGGVSSWSALSAMEELMGVMDLPIEIQIEIARE
jgi:hypothetical protein